MRVQSDLKEFARLNAWEYQMRNSQGLDSFSNYGGESLGNLVVVLSRSRDSEILDESNFEAALEMLGGESKHVQVHRFGHWGCGWFELILVNPKSTNHLKIAYDIKTKLDDYPVLDEMDYSEREYEYQSDYANGAKSDLADALELHFGVKHTKVLEGIAYELNIACQGYAGNDSCIDVYTGSAPDNSDIERLKRCLKEIEYNYTKSRVFKTLVNKVNAFEAKE